MLKELQIQEIVVGQGAEIQNGQTAVVHYTGRLSDKNGAKFDSSKDRNDPFEFILGAGQVIAGWDKGVLGMKIGGKRELTIPASMAYGEYGIPQAGIQGGATLFFEVELLGIN